MTRETQLGFQPPSIGEEEIEAVAETLRSGWLTTGPRAALLEERMAEYLEAKHVLAVASGTAAMHLALVALGIGEGDEVITSPITWPATANVIVHTGATPVFVDVREGDLNIDPALVEAAVTERTKAILPVHLAGQPCDLDPIWALGLPVIEDAAHAAESAYRGRKLGGLSDATCFSLYATKNIAAGEGGLVSTNRDDVADAIRNLRLMRRGDGSLYDITVPGYKANLSDVLAAIALVQLDKLPEHTAARERQFALYDEGLAGLDGIEPLERDPRDTHALHLYVVRVDAERFGLTRDELQRALTARADLDLDPLPARAPAHVVPRALPRPALASGRRACGRRDPLAAALAGALRRRHRGRARGARADSRPRRMSRSAAGRARRSLLTGLAVAYLVWKVDIGETVDVLADAEPWWFVLAVAIMTVTVVPMAERWRRLLASQGMRERLPWLTRAYLVAYTAGQILPTSIGGDAVRILETSRRHPARLGAISAIVLLERALGGAATVLLGAVGFLLAVGRYDVGAYLWIEGAFVLGHDPARVPLLRALGQAAAAPDDARAAAAPARAAGAGGLRRRARVPRPQRSPARAVRVHRRDPGRAGARDLGDGEVGRDRPLAAPLLRDGAALLPRPARPVHAQRLRRAGGVLRQLPRRRRRRCRPGLRRRLPLLPRHRRDGAARRR